jgi:DNA-directed RNA polymerase subunit RPC12/RpoP
MVISLHISLLAFGVVFGIVSSITSWRFGTFSATLVFTIIFLLIDGMLTNMIDRNNEKKSQLQGIEKSPAHPTEAENNETRQSIKLHVPYQGYAEKLSITKKEFDSILPKFRNMPALNVFFEAHQNLTRKNYFPEIEKIIDENLKTRSKKYNDMISNCTESKCPSCSKEISKIPKQSGTCKNCGEKFFVHQIEILNKTLLVDRQTKSELKDLELDLPRPKMKSQLHTLYQKPSAYQAMLDLYYQSLVDGNVKSQFRTLANIIASNVLGSVEHAAYYLRENDKHDFSALMEMGLIIPFIEELEQFSDRYKIPKLQVSGAIIQTCYERIKGEDVANYAA